MMSQGGNSRGRNIVDLTAGLPMSGMAQSTLSVSHGTNRRPRDNVYAVVHCIRGGS